MNSFESSAYARAIRIRGGHALGGAVTVSGYKHAFTLLAAASILTGSDVTLNNVPDSLETRILLAILQALGVEIAFTDHTLQLQSQQMSAQLVPAALSRQIHGSLYLLPALLGRFGYVQFGGAGGDRFSGSSGSSNRSGEHVLAVLEHFGVTFERSSEGAITGRCRRFSATDIDIRDYATHRETNSGPWVSGATKAAVLAAAVAEGTSVIHHPWNKEAAYELLSFLEACGCRMRLYDTHWEIEGGLHSSPVAYSLISDVTEIITFIACSVYMRCPIVISGITTRAVQQALHPEIEVLRAMGIKLDWGQNWLRVIPPDRLQAVDVVATSRGLNTDSHPFFTLMLLTAHRPCTVTDHVWPYRFAYVDHLNHLGAALHVEENIVFITPQRPARQGVHVQIADTRAGAVAILAALAIPGITTIEDMAHIHRGYERFIPRLQKLGAHIELDETKEGSF